MKTVKGKWKYEDGTPVAFGRVFFKLSQDAVAVGDAQIAPQLVSFNLDANGALGSGAGVLLYFNDELSPAQTTYTISVLAPGGGLVWGAESISISGVSPFDISSATPSTISVLLGNPVLQNPTGQQTINAYDLVMEGASLGLSASGSATGDVFLNRVSAGVLGIGTLHSGFAGTLKCSGLNNNSGNITNAVLTSATSGNTVSLLNEQSNLAPVTGNSADQNIFTFAIPANVVASSKAVYIRFWFGHSTGANATNYRFKIGATTISNYGSPVATGTFQGGIILRNQGGGLCTKVDEPLFTSTPGFQSAPGYAAGNVGDFSAGFTVSLTFNVANTDVITPQYWVAQLIQ